MDESHSWNRRFRPSHSQESQLISNYRRRIAIGSTIIENLEHFPRNCTPESSACRLLSCPFHNRQSAEVSFTAGESAPAQLAEGTSTSELSKVSLSSDICVFQWRILALGVRVCVPLCRTTKSPTASCVPTRTVTGTQSVHIAATNGLLCSSRLRLPGCRRSRFL